MARGILSPPRADFRKPLAEVLFWAGLLNVCAAHNDWANANFECGLQPMALSRYPRN